MAIFRRGKKIAVSDTDIRSLVDDKQDKLKDRGSYMPPSDGDYLAGLYKENDVLGFKRLTFAALWTWLIGRFSESITNDSTHLEAPTSRAVLLLVAPQTDRGDLAVKYQTGTTAGLSSIDEYDSNVERRCVKFGKMVQLSFQLKGTAVASAANWTYVGTVQTPYRPVRETPVVVQVYNNGTNEAAGGVITTSGSIKIWTNSKVAGNNYQMRCNVLYEGVW